MCRAINLRKCEGNYVFILQSNCHPKTVNDKDLTEPNVRATRNYKISLWKLTNNGYI